MIKIASAAAVTVAMVALIAACDMNGVPRVAGTYTGTVTVQAVDYGVSVQGSMRLVVEQSGDQITISGSATFDGVTTGITATSGTIDKTGFYTATRSGLIDSDAAGTTALCGRSRAVSSSLAFSGRQVELAGSAQTDQCGLLSQHATLTR